MEGSSATSTIPQLKFCKLDDPDTDISKNSDSQIMSSDALLRKMFENQRGDWEMVGSDGKAYKFHEEILNEQVAHFGTIFAHPETKECTSKQIVVPPEVEMTGPAVEAFLRYVYYQDTVPMNSSFDIACSLIRAGHYYDIPKMVEAANDALNCNGVLNKKPDWLHFEESWKLYQQVWLWEEGHPSKKNLMENLFVIIKEVSKSNSTRGSVSFSSGPLRDLLIRAFAQDQPSLPSAPLPISLIPTIPLLENGRDPVREAQETRRRALIDTLDRVRLAFGEGI